MQLSASLLAFGGLAELQVWLLLLERMVKTEIQRKHRTALGKGLTSERFQSALSAVIRPLGQSRHSSDFQAASETRA